jgi:hypothetical protein
MRLAQAGRYGLTATTQQVTLGAMKHTTQHATVHIQESDAQGRSAGAAGSTMWETPAEEAFARLRLQIETLQQLGTMAFKQRLVITHLGISWDLPESAFAQVPGRHGPKEG